MPAPVSREAGTSTAASRCSVHAAASIAIVLPATTATVVLTSSTIVVWVVEASDGGAGERSPRVQAPVGEAGGTPSGAAGGSLPCVGLAAIFSEFRSLEVALFVDCSWIPRNVL